MRSRPLILVVEPDETKREAVRNVLESAAFRIHSAATFDEAKQIIISEPPDILITELRLGPYNGLHLVLLSRNQHPFMGAIVTSSLPDFTMEAEVLRHQAMFLPCCLGDGALLEAVHQCLVRTGGGSDAAINVRPSAGTM